MSFWLDPDCLCVCVCYALWLSRSISHLALSWSGQHKKRCNPSGIWAEEYIVLARLPLQLELARLHSNGWMDPREWVQRGGMHAVLSQRRRRKQMESQTAVRYPRVACMHAKACILSFECEQIHWIQIKPSRLYLGTGESLQYPVQTHTIPPSRCNWKRALILVQECKQSCKTVSFTQFQNFSTIKTGRFFIIIDQQEERQQNIVIRGHIIVGGSGKGCPSPKLEALRRNECFRTERWG